MQRTKMALSIVLAVALLVGMGWGLYWLLTSLFEYLRNVPKELGAPLVAAAATIMAATATVMIGRYYERKRELDSLYREKKMEIYAEFIQVLFEQFHDGDSQNPEDVTKFIKKFVQKLILWSGPGPIAAFLHWKEHLAKGTPDAKSMQLTEQLLLALRSDLRHSNRGIPAGFFASFVLKESALFMELSKKNPNITLDQVAAIEVEINRAKNG